MALPLPGARDRIMGKMKRMNLSLAAELTGLGSREKTPKGHPGGLVSRKAWKRFGRLQMFKTSSGMT